MHIGAGVYEIYFCHMMYVILDVLSDEVVVNGRGLGDLIPGC